jgi:arginine-tRNA-protein transferase
MSDPAVTPEPPVTEMELVGTEDQCSYLPDQTSRMIWRLARRLTENRYEQLLERGWRRFGRVLFRPSCPSCTACQGLRVSVNDFQPSRSQRRCRDELDQHQIQISIQQPTLTAEHIQLYNSYHHDMHHRRGWPFRQINRDDYFESFIDGNFSFAREVQYRLDGRLIGLGLVDITSTCLSSIYFFHDPQWRQYGLGTWSVLQELQQAKKLSLQWIYMGYFIGDCQSMKYKSSFRPHQLLRSFPPDHVSPNWH